MQNGVFSPIFQVGKLGVESKDLLPGFQTQNTGGGSLPGSNSALGEEEEVIGTRLGTGEQALGAGLVAPPEVSPYSRARAPAGIPRTSLLGRASRKLFSVHGRPAGCPHPHSPTPSPSGGVRVRHWSVNLPPHDVTGCSGLWEHVAAPLGAVTRRTSRARS